MLLKLLILLLVSSWRYNTINWRCHHWIEMKRKFYRWPRPIRISITRGNNNGQVYSANRNNEIIIMMYFHPKNKYSSLLFGSLRYRRRRWFLLFLLLLFLLYVTASLVVRNLFKLISMAVQFQAKVFVFLVFRYNSWEKRVQNFIYYFSCESTSSMFIIYVFVYTASAQLCRYNL